MEPEVIRAPRMGMDMHINHYNNGLLDNNNVPAPRPGGKHGLKHGLDRSHAASATEYSPTDAVRAQAGYREGAIYRLRSLYQRFFSPQRQRQQERGSANSSRRTLRGKSATVDKDNIEDFLLGAADDMLALLDESTSEKRQSELEEMLADMFDVVGRYDVLSEALARVVDEPGDSFKQIAKNRAKRNALNEMMSNLYEQNPHELRRGLQDRETMLSSLQALSGDDSGKAPPTRKLRQMIGGMQAGSEDVQLTPLTVLKALIRNFGTHKCMSVMTGLRSRMMTGL